MALVNYFTKEIPEVLEGWDGKIHLQSVAGYLDLKEVTERLPCGEGYIEPPFRFDGSSSGIFRFLIPKWRHPIASVRHDFRCALLRQLVAEGMSMRDAQKLRKIADQLYREDLKIGQTSKTRSLFESTAGYTGVRIGAMLRIGFRTRRT